MLGRSAETQALLLEALRLARAEEAFERALATLMRRELKESCARAGVEPLEEARPGAPTPDRPRSLRRTGTGTTVGTAFPLPTEPDGLRRPPSTSPREDP